MPFRPPVVNDEICVVLNVVMSLVSRPEICAVFRPANCAVARLPTCVVVSARTCTVPIEAKSELVTDEIWTDVIDTT